MADTTDRNYPPGFSKPEDVPGEVKSGHKSLLELGSDMLQSFSPLNNIHLHLCGLHFYSGEVNRQVEAHHYCSHLTEDFCQCIITDGCDRNSRLIGIEYIISEKVFRTLPEEEKRYWHSHAYEVRGGLLVAPNLPQSAEKSLMKDLVNTYGKTFHTWQIDKGHNLPLGPPQLMMAATQDGQINPGMIALRDKNDKLVEKTSDRAKNRSDIVPAPIAQGANDWLNGKAIQCTMHEIDVTGAPPTTAAALKEKDRAQAKEKCDERETGSSTAMAPPVSLGATCPPKQHEREERDPAQQK